jgi:putative endonuclease
VATLYILYSRKLDRYYTGSCLDMHSRLKEHLQVKYDNAFTKKADDWEIYFRMDDLGYDTVRKLENHVKSMKSKKYIENLKAYPEMTEKLIEKFK